MSKTGKIASILAVFLLTILAIPFPATQVTANIEVPDVWVAPPPVGSNSNPGTQAQPFATIQWGINQADYAGTVHVAAGTYHENLVISGGTNLAGAGAPNTIIDGGGLDSVIAITSAPITNTISGFTIQNGKGTAVAGIDNPDDGKVLFAGINFKFLDALPQHFGPPINPPLLGGGMYIGGTHSVTIIDCVIKNNSADLGGGIYNRGQLFMSGCTISGNTASSGGGGIFNIDLGPFPVSGTMSLINCTISGNSVSGSAVGFGSHVDELGSDIFPILPPDGEILGFGGGIDNLGSMDLLNCTIANNSAPSVPGGFGGGFVNFTTTTAAFRNTIVANNTAGAPGTNNGYNPPPGVVISGGHNLDSENSCGFNQPTDLINTNPLLGALQDNGGPTFTQALLHDSPAIDAGVSGWTPNTDQRGVPRPQGLALDIGAYELAQDSVNTGTDVGTASFSTLNGYITDLTGLNLSQVECGPLPNFDFPYGLFSFNVTDITPGSTVTMVIILPSNAPEDTEYWKCINGNWVDCTSLLGSNDGDNILTLTITDGGLGDGDGLANGTIIDPGGPVLALIVPELKVSPTLPRLLNPPQMSVQYLNVSPSQAAANQPVTISTNVVNTGDQGGNLNVALKINGQVEQTRTVSVGPLASQQIKFTVTRTEPGTYSVDIGGQAGSFTIPGSSSNNRAPVNGGVIVLLVIGILVLASIMVVILSRRPAR